MDSSPHVLCRSIKSKKHSTLRCPNHAVKDEFCAKHKRTRIVWASAAPAKAPFTRRQKAAADKIHRFWLRYGRIRSRRIHGPTLFALAISCNDKDIYTFDPISTIPFTYHFSYLDSKAIPWTFDLRFLLQLMQYGKELINPFNQELIGGATLQRLELLAQALRKRNIPVVYAEADGLTPEQIWNQKVLDIFLKMNALGFPVNLVWFDMMTVLTHERFYTRLYNLWTYHLQLSEEQKETMVPGHASGRAPLFRWTPGLITSEPHELKWWRKQSLGLMKAFLTRGQDPITQNSNVIMILTALSSCHRYVAEAFPWLD